MKRIEELDFTRVVAMIAVITIHVTSAYIGYQSNILVMGMNVAFILNQLTRFAVPLFILLSGTSLGLSANDDSYRGFLHKRLTKIGIPYLAWTAVYIIYNNHSDLSAINFRSVLRTVLLGQAAPHLYFVVIIFQFYLIFPFLRHYINREPCKCILGAFVITYGIQKLFYFRRLGIDLIPNVLQPYLWLLFPTWIFYFVVGAVLSEYRLVLIRKFASQNTVTILFVTFLFSGLYVIESHITGNIESIKTSLDLYVPLVLLSTFSVWKYAEKIHASHIAVKILSKHSMTIYFMHVLVLRIFRHFSIFERGMSGMLFLLAAVFACSLFVAIFLDNIIWKVKANKTTH